MQHCQPAVEQSDCGRSAVVEMIMSALEAGEQPEVDRRAGPRRSHEIQASLQIEGKTGPRQITVYTRDADESGLGLYSPVPLSIGQAAVLAVTDPEGRSVQIETFVRRCRPV